MRLQKEVLMNGIGKLIYNTKDKMVGRVADVTKNKNNEPAFLILSSDSFSGFGSKYFAIPLTNSFIKVSDKGKIVLKVKKDDLSKSDSVEFDDTNIGGKSFVYSIFEIRGYHCPLPTSSSKRHIN